MRLFSIVVLVGLFCWRGSLPATESTPFLPGAQGGIIVPVTLNGAGPFSMLLDTGASHSAVSAELAQALQLQAVARTTVQTPVGSGERIVVRVDRMKVGAHEVRVRPSVVPRHDLAKAGDVHGVVGQDVLAALRYTIDFTQRRIAWHDGDGPGRSGAVAVLPLEFTAGLPFVDLPQGSSTLRLVPDSGAGGLVLFEGAGRRLPASSPGHGTVRVDAFQGGGHARPIILDRFRVGASVLRGLPAVVVEQDATGAGDGLLPLHLFDRVTFDGPGRRLILG